MSRESELIKQQYPGKTMYFLAPRDLDGAIAMVEEREDLNGLRIIYSKPHVAHILVNKLKWPLNKVSNYFMVAYLWGRKTLRAPLLLNEDEIRDILEDKGEDCDGDCENCNYRH